MEGAGGGHIPDLLGLVREANILCSSTTPGLPWGPGAAAEHVDMILIVHEGNPLIPEDVAGARERIRDTTLAAEGPLHDLGAISIINSDSQGMGRIGETIRRTWQLADAMKRWRGSDLGAGWPGEPADDNERVLRYLAKHTAEPAIAHGIADEVGSLEPGHLADLVLWEPASFGVRPVHGDQGRRRGLERDGRGQRQRPRRPAHPLRTGLGRHGRRGRVACRRRSSPRQRSTTGSPRPWGRNAASRRSTEREG